MTIASDLLKSIDRDKSGDRSLLRGEKGASMQQQYSTHGISFIQCTLAYLASKAEYKILNKLLASVDRFPLIS